MRKKWRLCDLINKFLNFINNAIFLSNNLDKLVSQSAKSVSNRRANPADCWLLCTVYRKLLIAEYHVYKRWVSVGNLVGPRTCIYRPRCHSIERRHLALRNPPRIEMRCRGVYTRLRTMATYAVWLKRVGDASQIDASETARTPTMTTYSNCVTWRDWQSRSGSQYELLLYTPVTNSLFMICKCTNLDFTFAVHTPCSGVTRDTREIQRHSFTVNHNHESRTVVAQ